MKQVSLRQYNCMGCPERKYHHGISMKDRGIMLHEGTCYCFGAKKPHKFKKSELKKVPPTWCPKRKNSVEITLYTFKSDIDEMSFMLFRQFDDPKLAPESFRYAKNRSWATSVTAQEFANSLKAGEDVLGEPIPMYAVLCFDDGLMKHYFFKRYDGFVYEPYFSPPQTQGDA